MEKSGQLHALVAANPPPEERYRIHENIGLVSSKAGVLGQKKKNVPTGVEPRFIGLLM